MDKVITIYSGDEHRAKMEKQFSRTDLFAEVYSKAYKLVTQIEDEMKRYNEVNKNRLTRYQGMGNNIIIFCGGRGQGKTSVMQSFAKCLDGSYKSERTIAESEMLEFVREISNEKYEVVDSIDPSAMENGESILRVLISRLFFKMEEYIDRDDCSFKDNIQFLQSKKKIVELFEKCYANIECIKNGKKADCGQDDLQNLSQMGSSAKLKENLFELIHMYLTVMAGFGKSQEEKSRYLVIPIDDADLATKRLFRLCEDIRNYLSIPNVIILMAADYEQLVHATYQRYLKQYKVMRKADALSAYRTQIEEECHKMAAKYLEKVFPIIHRIDLPQIDSLLKEDHENIRFRYRWGETDESVFEDMGLEDCQNLQDQLIKILYSRTGLVFSVQDQGLHPFMPHTLRELTHWLKMLHDMHAIDCDQDVYRLYQKSEDMTEELEQNISRLKENILTVKQYFVSYWCEKYLDISAARAFQKIDNLAIRQLAKSKSKDNASSDLSKAPAAARMIYRILISNDINRQEEHFQTAVCIYDTIFMNEWFVLALKDTAQFREIARFVGKAVNLSGDFNDKNMYMGKYHTIQFDIDVDALREAVGPDMEPAVDSCIKNFCAVKQGDQIDESIEISNGDSAQVQINPAIETLEFDVLRPVLAQLLTAGDIEPADDGLIRAPYLVTVRNIIANYDIQMQVRNVVISWYEYNNENTEFVPLNNQVPSLYEEIGDEIDILQEKLEDNITGICTKAISENEEMLEVFFLCNHENCRNYLIQIKDAMSKCCSYVRIKVGSIEKKIMAKDAARIAEVQKLIEELLGRLERESEKAWSVWYMLDPIKDVFELKKEWSELEAADNKVDQLMEQLRNLKTEAEEQLASLAEEKSDDAKSGKTAVIRKQPEGKE